MEIKRVIAGGLTALAAGATLAFGVGAVTLGDFVQVTGNTMTSPYIVIGGNAAAEDTLAAADVGVALAGQATEAVTVAGAQASMSVSDGTLIEGEAYKLYIGTQLSDDKRKNSLTKEDLPVVLAGGTVDQKTITDTDYDEFIDMSSQSVTWSKETDWDEAALNLQFPSGTVAYTYSVVFSSGLDTEYIEGKDITLLGKDYVFSSQDSDLDNNTLTLFAAGQTETVAAGESTTVTVNGNDYVITVVGVNTDGTSATIDINGEAFDVDPTDDNYIQKSDLNLYIKSIRAFKFPVESGSVELFVGSDKLVFDDSNADITKGTETLEGATVSFGTTAATDNADKEGVKIYELTITYTPDEDTFVQAGESFADPVFGAFKIAFGGISPALDSSSKDLIKIDKSSSQKVKLEYMNKAGETCSFDVYNTTEWAYGTGNGKRLHVVNPTAGGSGVTNALNNWTQPGNISEGEYFLVSESGNKNSYILQYVSTDSTNNIIKLKDVCSGTTFDASTTTKFFYLGGQKYTFDFDASEVIRVNQTAKTTNPNADAVTLYTQGKNEIVLYATTPGEFHLTEADYSTEGVQGATRHAFNVSTTLDGSNEVSGITVANTSALVAGFISPEGDTDNSYTVSASGTYFAKNTDSETLHIYAPKNVPAPVFVAVGADPMFSAGSDASGGTVMQAVQIKNSISKMESEVDTAALNRDLVLIGGPCANGLTAEALGMSSSNPECATEFTAMYPTEGVIKVVEDAFGSGHKALVVAGVNRAATRDLGVKVMQGTVDYSA